MSYVDYEGESDYESNSCNQSSHKEAFKQEQIHLKIESPHHMMGADYNNNSFSRAQNELYHHPVGYMTTTEDVISDQQYYQQVNGKIEEISVLLNSSEDEDKAAEVFQIKTNENFFDRIIPCDINRRTNNITSAYQSKKKQTLQEKREMKKIQLQQTKSYETSNQNECESLIFEVDPFLQSSAYLTKEERQRIKNRESAQVSRDRKKFQDNLLQQNLKDLTKENQKLRNYIERTLRVNTHPTTKTTTDTASLSADCSHFEHLHEAPTSTKVNSSTEIIEVETTPFEDCFQSSAQPVFQFFDFSIRNVQSTQLQKSAAHQTVSGWNSQFIVIMILAMILLSGTAKTDGELTHIQIERLTTPYGDIYEQCKGMSQGQLLECLAFHLQKLGLQERSKLVNQLNLFEILHNNNDNNSKQQPLKSILDDHTALLKALTEFNKEQEVVNRKENAELMESLQKIHEDKLQQIEHLKLKFCYESEPIGAEFTCDWKMQKSDVSSNNTNSRVFSSFYEESDQLDEDSFSFDNTRKQRKLNKIYEGGPSIPDDMYSLLFVAAATSQPKPAQGINYYQYLLSGTKLEETPQPQHDIQHNQQQQSIQRQFIEKKQWNYNQTMLQQQVQVHQ